MRYPFEHHILVCTGGRCNDPARGIERGEVIRAELKELNKGLGRKPAIRICAVSCLDLCDYGPNLIAWPEGTVYSHLDRESARRVYHGICGDTEPAADKELSDE
ncbi:MAG TPA: (2Fe-2S) ferredoxin domain-containing protein [Thermoanaerobaculia bacterium]|nr:(2Fe-2S) ferredoxin domain-containing protein [Thermoanaerobaculia bacterium]